MRDLGWAQSHQTGWEFFCQVVTYSLFQQMLEINVVVEEKTLFEIELRILAWYETKKKTPKM